MPIDIPINKEIVQGLFYVSLTFLIAVIINAILRSFIKMPNNFENRRAHTYVTVARNMVTIIVYVITIYIVLVTFGFNLTPLLASAGVIGVIIGISARTFIEDLINGFFLLTQESIAVGDYVKLDAAEGFIEKIGARSLTVRADNGALYIIPNGQVKMVINYSRHRAYQPIDLVVKSDQDIDKALKAMNEALVSLQRDKELGDSIHSGSVVEGLEEFKSDGKMIIRATIITRVAIGKKVARKFRYLAKKNFEKYKVALV
jgi:small-conductance mechanosensitive channel